MRKLLFRSFAVKKETARTNPQIIAVVLTSLSEIDYEDVVQNRLQYFPERLVVGVGQVGVSGLLVGEGQDEAMGKSLVQTFRTVVRSPFQAFDLCDLFFLLQVLEGLLHLRDLLLGGVFLELEAHDVSNFLEGEKKDEAGDASFATGDFVLPLRQQLKNAPSGKAILGTRPEDISLATSEGGDSRDDLLEGTLEVLEDVGEARLLHVRVADSLIVAKVSERPEVEIGSKVSLTVDSERCHLFEPKTEKNLSV